LEVKYDKITKSEYLDFYSLKEKEKHGFLIVKRNEIKTWGGGIKNTQEVKDFIRFPKLDFPISKEKGLIDTYYTQN
jgi:hypothetical protein